MQLLLDERAITRTLHRYCHAMDYGLEEEWVDVFTSDAVFDVIMMPAGAGIHRENGREELARYIANYPKPPRYSKHIILDPIIDIDGDQARVESFFLFLAREDDVARLIVFGRYKDSLRKADGKWRIAERIAEVETAGSSAARAAVARR
jgi:3-phenylpropionate/cinnamic acid dioxygenase small subunit